MGTNIEKKIIDIAKNVLLDESEAIKSLINTIDDSFESIIKAILASEGKLVISGIGKSAIVAQKIVATLNSTGQKSVFLHAADALHGDLGIIDKNDLVMVLSKSGNTPEIKVLLPLIKRLGSRVIAMVSDLDSYLALNSDYVINAHVKAEACPLNLAPTTSTTVSMALGDALAVCLLEARGFSNRDFAKYHPGGSLGKKLYLKVADIYPNNELPLIYADASINEVILEISSKRLGAVAVVNENHNLLGIVTDGDLRRMLSSNKDFSQLKASEIMSVNPKSIDSNEYAVNALGLMQDLNITQLIITKANKVVGFVHLHDLLKEGLI